MLFEMRHTSDALKITISHIPPRVCHQCGIESQVEKELVTSHVLLNERTDRGYYRNGFVFCSLKCLLNALPPEGEV